jgi:hypothetical protein
MLEVGKIEREREIERGMNWLEESQLKNIVVYCNIAWIEVTDLYAL